MSDAPGCRVYRVAEYTGLPGCRVCRVFSGLRAAAIRLCFDPAG